MVVYLPEVVDHAEGTGLCGIITNVAFGRLLSGTVLFYMLVWVEFTVLHLRVRSVQSNI